MTQTNQSKVNLKEQSPSEFGVINESVQSHFFNSRWIGSKMLSQQLIKAIIHRISKLGIPKCSGQCRLDVSYRWCQLPTRHYDGKSHSVRLPYKLHHIPSVVTWKAVDKVCEREKIRRIKEDEREGKRFYPLRKRLINELHYCLAVSQKEEAEMIKNEIELRNQHLDRVHEELSWTLHKQKILHRIEEARNFARSFFYWERPDQKSCQIMADTHYFKSLLNQQVKEIASLLRKEEQDRKEEENRKVAELKERMLSELITKIRRNKLPEMEAREAEWRMNAMKKYRYDSVRRNASRIRLATNSELLDVFRRVEKKMEEEDRKYRMLYHKRMSQVMNELQNRILKYPARIYPDLKKSELEINGCYPELKNRKYRRRGN